MDPNDRPLGITDSIKLLTDIIILSKYFLKKPLHDMKEPEKHADKLYCQILSLENDLKDQKEAKKKEKCAQTFLMLAKADLFPEGKDKDHVSNFLGKKILDDYIDHYTKEKYHPALKQLVDRACHLCVLGFASFNLLMERQQYDKDIGVSSPYDAKAILSSEKNKIVNLVATLAKAKTSSTKAGLIATIQIEIMSDVEHLREKFQSIEMALLKKKKEESEYQLALFSKNPISDVADRKISEQLFNEKKALEERVKTLEKRLEDTHQKHASEIKTLTKNFENEKHLLESKILPDPDAEYQKKMRCVAILALSGVLLTSFGLGAWLGIPLLFAATFVACGIMGIGLASGAAYSLRAEHHPERKTLSPVLLFKKPSAQTLDVELKVLTASK
jgi:hypothetical protein